MRLAVTLFGARLMDPVESSTMRMLAQMRILRVLVVVSVVSCQQPSSAGVSRTLAGSRWVARGEGGAEVAIQLTATHIVLPGEKARPAPYAQRGDTVYVIDGHGRGRTARLVIRADTMRSAIPERAASQRDSLAAAIVFLRQR